MLGNYGEPACVGGLKTEAVNKTCMVLSPVTENKAATKAKLEIRQRTPLFSVFKM